MNTLSILLLATRILKLNLKVMKRLNQGAEPSSLRKDFELLLALNQRLLSALNTKVDEQRMHNGTAAARTPASKLG